MDEPCAVLFGSSLHHSARHARRGCSREVVANLCPASKSGAPPTLSYQFISLWFSWSLFHGWWVGLDEHGWSR